MHVIFLHGLESGPHGSKFRSMRDAGWDVTAPDCEGVADVDARVGIARRALAEASAPAVLVGSSFGGLTAALLYSTSDAEERAKVHGLLLLAPAFHLEPAEEVVRCPPNAVILHGTNDDVVPIDASRMFAGRHGLELVEVEDGHRLAGSHAEVLRLLSRVARPHQR